MSEEEYTLASMLDAITHPRAKPPKGELAKVTHAWVVTLREEDEDEVTTTILGVFRTEPTDAMRCLRSGLSRGMAVAAERVELKS